MRDVGPIPRRDPLSYPGVPLMADALVELGGGQEARATPLVVVEGRPLAEATRSDGRTVADLLASLGAAAIENRTPVIAVGSNASLAQMAHKFAGSTERVTYPQVVAAVAGLDVGYAPTVAAYGAVPATPVPGEGTVALVVQLLDATTLAALDATESGYRRVALTPRDGVTARLPTGEVLPQVDAYVAEAGYLSDGGRPVLLGDGPGRLTQREILARLVGEPDIDAYVASRVRVPQDEREVAEAGTLREDLRNAIPAVFGTEPTPLLA